MTVKELKAFLKPLPADAEVFFDLWQSDDKFHHFQLKRGNGKIQTNKLTGEQCVSIGHADNCIADKIGLKGE